MNNEPNRIAFVLASTEHGSMIINRLDYNPTDQSGVGLQIMEFGNFEGHEIETMGKLLIALRHTRGNGLLVVDGGSNVGTHTLTWGRQMRGWGEVIAIEPQERVFYALCGNIAMNNLFNCRAIWAALSDKEGTIAVPSPDYQRPISAGSLTLKLQNAQQVEEWTEVRAITIDSLNLVRLDMMKLDLEGMEPEALTGSIRTIKRCKPIVIAEHTISGRVTIEACLAGYRFYDAGMNMIAIHRDDPVLAMISIVEMKREPVAA